MEEIFLTGDDKYDILKCLKPYISDDEIPVHCDVDLAQAGADETALLANGEIGKVESVRYIVSNDLEPCQPPSGDWFDDRRHSKCKKHRREARGWR